MKKPPHIPILLTEILRFFEDKKIHSFVDGTLGAGGHSAAILEAHPEIEVFIGIDQDPEALEIARERLSPWKDKITLFNGNFSSLKTYFQEAGISKADGMLFDLGVSSMQLDRPEKGFSFMRNGPLDMRMNPEDPLTAAEIVNTWSEQELGRVFRDYGEEKKWRTLARTLVAVRKEKTFQTTHDLVEVLRPLFPYKPKGINPMTLIFQALRICVNRELESLELMLLDAIDLLAPQGRMGVISFHSLEDHIVKNEFRFAADDKYNTSGIGGVFLDKKPIVKVLTRKPLAASEEEVAVNPRSRSARLRFIEKLDD